MLAFYSCVCCCCIITVYCFVIAVLLPLINWLINWYVLSQDIRLSPPSFFVGKFRMLLRVDKSLAGFGLIATFVQETGRGLVMATVILAIVLTANHQNLPANNEKMGQETGCYQQYVIADVEYISYVYASCQTTLIKKESKVKFIMLIYAYVYSIYSCLLSRNLHERTGKYTLSMV